MPIDYTPVLNGWTTFALEKRGNTFYLYQDGELKYTYVEPDEAPDELVRVDISCGWRSTMEYDYVSARAPELHRRTITVDNTNNPDTLTNYQVFVNITYDSSMQPDFDDLRFTWYDDTSGQEVSVDYWLDKYVDSEYALIWVEVPSIRGLGQETLYMYYGDPDATSASNGEETFVFFDGFSTDTTANYQLWSPIHGSGNPNEFSWDPNGWLFVNASIREQYGRNSNVHVYHKTAVMDPSEDQYWLESRCKAFGDGWLDYLGVSNLYKRDSTPKDVYFRFTNVMQGIRDVYPMNKSGISGGWGSWEFSNSSDLPTSVIDQWFRIGLGTALNGTVIGSFRDDDYGELSTLVGQTTHQDTKWWVDLVISRILTDDWATMHAYFDYVRVRKFTDPEPSYSISPPFSPWDDEDGDNIENFLDLEGFGESLFDYGVPEERYDNPIGNFASVWKFDIGYKIYIVWPETRDEVSSFTAWVKDHVASSDYDFVTADLLDRNLPFMVVVEIDKDILTLLPFIGFMFELLPAAEQDNIVRWSISLGWDDVWTLAELLTLYRSDPGAVIPNLVYSSPCLTDGDGLTSHLTGNELWFRFARPKEWSIENAAKFFIKAVASLIPLLDLTAQGIITVGELAGAIIYDVLISGLIDLVFDAYETGEQLLSDAIMLRLEDPEGDVDMSLYVDQDLGLGCIGETTIPSSTYGEYLGDFSTELMVVYADQIIGNDVEIWLTAQETNPEEERITLSWLSFHENDLVNSGEEELSIVEGATYVYTVNTVEEVIVIEPDPMSELEHLKEFVDGLPDDSFDQSVRRASHTKKALFSKIDDAILKVEAGNYTDAVNKLLHDIRAKMDGDHTAEDWIVHPETQFDLCVIVDHIISSIETLQQG